MPRKRSNIKSHLKHVPEEYHKKTYYIKIAAIIIIAYFATIFCIIAIMTYTLNNAESRVQNYGLKVQTTAMIHDGVKVVTYYTDKIEVREGYIFFIDDKGTKVTCGIGALVTPDRIKHETDRDRSLIEEYTESEE